MSNERRIGMYRTLRRRDDSKQIEALEKADCGRIWPWEEQDKLVRYLRNGDAVVLPQAHCLGSRWREIEALMTQIFNKGATIEVLEPAMSANTLGAAQIAFAAMSGLEGDSRAHTTAEARKYGKMNREVFAARRTPETVARRFWHSRKAKEMTVSERLLQPEMRGWSKETAYRIFGAPGAKAGPKRRT